MDALSLSAADILALPLTHAGDIFDRQEATAKHVLGLLRSKWHPDKCSDVQAPAVFHRLTELYDHSRTLAAGPLWITSSAVYFQYDGSTVTFKYVHADATDISRVFIANGYVMEVFNPDAADLGDAYVKNVQTLTFADGAMEKQMRPQLPKVVRDYVVDDYRIVVVSKTPGTYRLSDVVRSHPDLLTPTHVAWIVSGLLNHACYLRYAERVHAGITLSNIYIQPDTHMVCIIGGWWSAVKQGSKLSAVPADVIPVLPRTVISSRRADLTLNTTLIRAACRELLGDRTGSRLLMNKKLPKAMVTWAMGIGGDAVEDYRYWLNEVLVSCFGKRTFVDFGRITNATVYRKEK